MSAPRNNILDVVRDEEGVTCQGVHPRGFGHVLVVVVAVAVADEAAVGAVAVVVNRTKRAAALLVALALQAVVDGWAARFYTLAARLHRALFHFLIHGAKVVYKTIQ